MALPDLLGSIINRACSHEFSWPYQLSGGGYYQTCARCGNQFEFDWETMARGEKVRKSMPSAQPPSPLPSARVWVPRARRFAACRPIFYRQTGHSQFHLGVLLDMSESGILVECQATIPEGQELEVIFTMPCEITGQLNRNVLSQGVVARVAVSEQGIPLIGIRLSSYRFLGK
jgi:PilZ domain